jgi:hypothetical protein
LTQSAASRLPFREHGLFRLSRPCHHARDALASQLARLRSIGELDVASVSVECARHRLRSRAVPFRRTVETRSCAVSHRALAEHRGVQRPPMPLTLRPENRRASTESPRPPCGTSEHACYPITPPREEVIRQRPSHGVCCTYSASNREQRLPAPARTPVLPARVSTPRLRYAFRLSQPLDVFFRSRPFQPYFMLVALMGLGLRRFPLSGSWANVTRATRGRTLHRSPPVCRFRTLS